MNNKIQALLEATETFAKTDLLDERQRLIVTSKILREINVTGDHIRMLLCPNSVVSKAMLDFVDTVNSTTEPMSIEALAQLLYVDVDFDIAKPVITRLAAETKDLQVMLGGYVQLVQGKGYQWMPLRSGSEN